MLSCQFRAGWCRHTEGVKIEVRWLMGECLGVVGPSPLFPSGFRPSPE